MEERSVHKNFVFQISTMVVAGLILHYLIPPKKDFHIPQANVSSANYSGTGKSGNLNRKPSNTVRLQDKAEQKGLKNQEIIGRGLQIIRSQNK